jgi:hypothetical protein
MWTLYVCDKVVQYVDAFALSRGGEGRGQGIKKPA